MRLKEAVLKEEIEKISIFLKQFNLVYEDDIDHTFYIEEDDTLLATISISGQIIKCVAIHAAYQGMNLLNQLMSHLIKTVPSSDHLFVYTQPEHVDIFKSLGFKEIVQSMHLSFMERSGDIEVTLKRLKKKYQVDSTPKGSVVVNANPFTKGHKHLIEEAAKHHQTLIVFVVSEDRSFFPFKDRFTIIKESFKHHQNIYVVPTKDYLVSYATFPKYFQKNETLIKKDHALIDVLTFKKHYMKVFNISKRYVGEEPYSPMTDIYNQTMKEYLGKDLIIIARKSLEDVPISASTVRKLLKKNGIDSVRKYVPKETFDYLLSEKGQSVIRRIKHYDKRH